MSSEIQFKTKEERDKFADFIMSFANDPYGWVLACYPWGEPGQLEKYTGPDRWQRRVLKKIGRQLKAGKKNIRISVSSGHGVGKTALVAWIIHWFISTHPNPQIVVTANTQQQLRNKTWRELAKWKNMAINGFMFDWTATTYSLKNRADTWFASAVPWSKQNSEAFAGTHEEHVMVIFDEASGIDDIIHEVAEGAFTSHGGIWLQFGNCTRATGRFFENMFGRFRERWDTIVVDARDAMMRNDELIKEWIEDWGIDSDFVRVRVLGLPPKQGDLQFIGTQVVQDAVDRVIDPKTISDRIPRLMGVDVARQGADTSKVVMRQGRLLLPVVTKAGIKPLWTYRIRDTTQLAQRISELITINYPDVVFVDGVGIGAGVVDMLRRFGHDNIIEVQAGSKPTNQKLYLNKRIEMWDRMRMWLEVADIPDEAGLRTDLTAPEYYFDDRTDKMRLESKKDMKARNCASPDAGDAVAHTFYVLAPSKTQFFNEDSMEPDMV